MNRLLLPTLDVNTTHATLTAWHKKPGDKIAVNDILCELTTDKAAFDLESPYSGTLLKTFAPLTSILPSGYILALIGAPGETDPFIERDNIAILEAATAALEGSSSNKEDSSPKSPQKNLNLEPSLLNLEPSKIRATPKARRLAQQHNLDLAAIQRQTGATLIDEQTLLPFIK